MVPSIGFIVAVYCVARLLQVPFERDAKPRLGCLWAISAPAILVILFFAIDLFFQSARTPK